MTLAWVAAAILAIGSAVATYAWLEAGWLRCRVLEVDVPGLPAELDGLRVGHLSDFHFGAPLSLGNRAGTRAARWIAERRPDLVAITGDLVSHPRGERRLREALAELARPLVVLGNHDVAVTRDPFSRAAELDDLESAILLRDEAIAVELRGIAIQVVGVDPESYPTGGEPSSLADPGARFRLLLCHYPGVVRRMPPGTFQLTLAGHLHAGQICLPLPGRRVTLAHPRARHVAGLDPRPGRLIHVSPGTGTTFVPFRFGARPEVTELVLHARPGGTDTGVD